MQQVLDGRCSGRINSSSPVRDRAHSGQVEVTGFGMTYPYLIPRCRRYICANNNRTVFSNAHSLSLPLEIDETLLEKQKIRYMRLAARSLPALSTLSKIPLRASVRLASTTSVMSPVDPKSIPSVSDNGVGKRMSIWRGQ